MKIKLIKPNLDLVLARLSIFGILAILFTILSVNGITPWFLWVLMLIGIFSIFSAAIDADEDLNAFQILSVAINKHSKKIKSERDEYKGIAENFEELYLREMGKTQALRKQLERLEYRDNGAELMKPPSGCPHIFKSKNSFKSGETSQDIIESILVRSLDNPEIQDLCAKLLDVLDQSEGEKL